MKISKKLLIKFFKPVVVISLIYLLFVGCTNSRYSSDNSQPHISSIAVSVLPEKAYVDAITGNSIDVITTIPPGKDFETYSPTPKEIESLSNASIYFSIGIPAEEQNILSKAREINPNLLIVNLLDEVENVYPSLYSDEDASTGDRSDRDPHIWVSPRRAKVIVDVITEYLSKLSNDNRSIYYKNANEYKEKLDQLNTDITQLLKDTPRKSFIIYHPELGYFAKDYGLNMYYLQHEEKESTIKNLEDLINIARHEKIDTVFCQKEFDSKHADSFAKDIGATVQRFTVLSENYIENLRTVAQSIATSLK